MRNPQRRKFPLLLLLAVPIYAFSQATAPVAMRDVAPPYEHAVRQATQKSLHQALDEIKTRFDVKFIFETKVIRDRTVLADFSPVENVDQVLARLSTQVDLRFKKIGDRNHMILKKKKEEKLEKLTGASPKAPGLTTLSAVPVPSVNKEPAAEQQKTISGKVTDENNEGLPGVNIVVKNTTLGTVTDVDGNYQLSVPDEATTLVFSSVGYLAREVAIDNQTVINIEMTPDVQSLEEVVVIGYGTQKKRDLTGAISSVSSKEIEEISVTGFDQAIEGKLSGVRVVNANPSPGAGLEILIRGPNSIQSSTFPLIVVDGMPLPDDFNYGNNPFNAINPNDIASIEVLKDASAAAIYGTRAANGVVLVTTKRGGQGKARINFSARYGLQQVARNVELADRDQFLDYYWAGRNHGFWKLDTAHFDPDYEGGLFALEKNWQWDIGNSEERLAERMDIITANPGVFGSVGSQNPDRAFWFGGFNRNYLDDPNTGAEWQRNLDIMQSLLTNPNAWPNTRWTDVIQNDGRFPGRFEDYSLSSSGGNERMAYYVSGSYTRNQGTIRNTQHERLTAILNLDFNITDRLDFGFKLQPSLQDLDRIDGSRAVSTWFDAPLYANVFGLPPIYPATDEDGIVHLGRGSEINNIDFGLDRMDNPLWTFLMTDNTRTFRNLGSLFGEYEILKGLTLRSEISTDFTNTVRDQFRPIAMGSRNSPPGTRGESWGANSTSSSFYWYLANTLNYKRVFGKHEISLLAGYTAEERTVRSSRIRKVNFPTDEIITTNQTGEIKDPVDDVRNNLDGYTLIGTLGRLIYNFDSKYYLTGTVRRDGSSRFGQNNRWGTFPSVSAAWRVSGENFMQNIRFISDLKLRAGYGTSGNSGIGNYNAIRLHEVAPYILDNTLAIGYLDRQLPDRGLGWEESREFNLGVDVSLLENRLDATVEVYDKRTESMLFPRSLPDYSGFGSFLTNMGKMQSRGWEVSVLSRNLVGAFNWTSDFNISAYNTRILALGPDGLPVDGQQNAGRISMVRNFIGHPYGTFFGSVYLGTFSSFEEVFTDPSRPLDNDLNTDPARLRDKASFPGDQKVADVNGDGIIDGNDETIIGSPEPDFFWGLGNTFQYKDFDLRVQLSGVVGAQVLNAVMSDQASRMLDGRQNVREDMLDYWSPTNTDGYWVTPARRQGGGFDKSTSYLVEKGDFIKINTINLGYNFPAAALRRLKINTARVYINVQNAFIFSRYSGANPEASQRGDDESGRARTFGVDGGGYPPMRVFAFGVNLGL